MIKLTVRCGWIGILVGMMSWAGAAERQAKAHGWLNWRGPQQMGVSQETGLPDALSLDSKDLRWSVALSGRGTPVIAIGRVFAFGYDGEGQDLQEVLRCIDAATGKTIWEHRFNDFLSDIIYKRYSIGSPTVDAETGNVYILTSPGIMAAFSAEGQLLWEHSMMERFGRLTFPNGRTGAPAIDGHRVIVQGITANWGANGPASNRFYAFDKRTGELIWESTPGVRPTDSSFSTPIFADLDGRRVFYCGTGCGNIVCVDARTGQPLSRFQLLTGGINASLLLYKGHTVIAIHGKENLDTSEIGRMVAVKMDRLPAAREKGPVILGKEAELWRNPLGIFTSSGVLVGNRVYQVGHTGSLYSVDADSGKVLWEEKLSYTQLHASPLFADGKLYVPMKDGFLHIIRPRDQGPELLSKVKLEGECLGAPAIWNGRLYIHTTAKLYCFGPSNQAAEPPVPKLAAQPKPGKAAAFRVIPTDVLLRPGQSVSLKVEAIDDKGVIVPKQKLSKGAWESYIPPTAKVKSRLSASLDKKHRMTAAKDPSPSAGMFRGRFNQLTGYARGRILPDLPFVEDFESFELNQTHKLEGVAFGFPPLPWIGARFKWEIRADDQGNKVLSKTLENLLFQRAMTFLGHPDMDNYTMTADVKTDGNRRIKSTVGLINQRYVIALDGNWQNLEVSSNHDRIKVSVPFSWQPGRWYRLKTRVDVAEDGSGVVRAKAWEKGSTEPDTWTIEVPHKVAHRKGSPGLFGFSPQGKKRVYIDNISIESNK